MKFQRIKWIAMLLVLTLLGEICVPVRASAMHSEFSEMTIGEKIKVRYFDKTNSTSPRLLRNEVLFYTSPEEAAVILREGMEQRLETIEIYYETDGEDISKVIDDIRKKAFVHTGVATEGDYLAFQYGGSEVDIYFYGSNKHQFIFHNTYYTSAEQEDIVEEEIEKVLSSLSLDDKTDYEKIKAIYDYICCNTVYDYENLNDTEYKLKYTAYAALLNKTSVCQGYALLLYRMLLESGIDCRIITGVGNGGRHAWNIVELGDAYYNADATWDAVYMQAGFDYNFFLSSNAGFKDHIRDAKYETTEFNNMYGMSMSNYEPAAPCDGHIGGTASCTKRAICTICGQEYGNLQPHDFDLTKWIADESGHWHACKKCTAADEKLYHTYTDDRDATCNDCGEARTVVVPEVIINDTGCTLSLDGVIYINQYVILENCEEIDLTQDAGLLIWKREVTEEDALFGTEDVLRTGLEERGGEYVQQSHGIAAKEYGDTIYFRVYVKNEEDTYVYGPLKDYSVRTYCDKVFANPDVAGENLVNTCAAMLHYGAAAQKNFDYKLDALVNEGIPYPAMEWNPKWINATDPFITNIVASDKVTDTGRTLSLDGAIVMNCYYKFAGNAKSAELLVWDGVGGELTVEKVSYTVDMRVVGSEFLGNPKAFAAKEYDKTIYVCARFVDEDGSVHYSDVVAYHPEQYAANVLASDRASEKLKETVKNMVTYGQFAGINFGTK